MTTYAIDTIEFVRTKLRPNGRWVWVTNPSVAEILAGAEKRRATAAEARQLNAMYLADPPVMTLPSAHPSYRI